MTASLGVNVVSPERPAWSTQIARLALLRPDAVKVQIPPGFGTSARQLAELLDAIPSIHTVILRGEDCGPTFDMTHEHLIGRGFADVLRARPRLTGWVEVGNEPDRCGMEIGEYRAHALATVRNLRPLLAHVPNLRWTISLPTQLTLVEALFSEGEYERLCDGVATHLYGHHYLLDPGRIDDDYTHLPTEWEHIWRWLLTHTRLPLLITEGGINDVDKTDDEEKARRYLEFVRDAPARLEALLLWASVSDDPAWRNYRLSDAALRRMGEREGGVGMATPIFGPTRTTIADAEAWARARGAHPHFIGVLPYYYKHGPRYEIPAENGIGQSSWETNDGHFTGVVQPDFHNWAGIKTKDATGDLPKDHQRFPDDETGVIAHLQHLAGYGGKRADQLPDPLVDPRFHFISKHTSTMEGLGGAWAPAASYGQNVSGRIASIPKSVAPGPGPGPAPAKRLKVALSAGHHNADRGGTSGEFDRTGELTEAIARAMRLHGGFEVRVITPDGPDPDDEPGDGVYPGDLFEAARHVVVWRDQGWTADLFLEVHFEGTGSPSTRGCFAIYPDWLPDVDAEMRDRLGPALARAVSAATGIPLRGNGTMSEKSTGVGGQGFRLGVFRATEPLRASTSRTVFEFGALTNAADRDLINRPEFNANAARGVVAALAAHYGLHEGGEAMPPPAPLVIVQEGNPNGALTIERGFAGHLWKLGWIADPSNPLAGILAQFGWVEKEEYETDFGSTIELEKSVWDWLRDHVGTVWEFQQRQIPKPSEDDAGDDVDRETVEEWFDEIEASAAKIAEAETVIAFERAKIIELARREIA